MNATSLSPLENAPLAYHDKRRIRIGSSVICRRTGLVETPGNVDKLRRKELDLVSYLYENSARVVTRDELLSKVWNCSRVVTRTVDQTIATLRRKLGDDYRSPRHLITVHGLGYMLRHAG
jgi:DNA-binding response OmpR family regulator